MRALLALTAILLLTGCGIEPDSWYCKQNGYQPGTDDYLQCIGDHAQSRVQASIALMQIGQREASGY